MDAIRALLFLGTPPLSTEIASALDWMKRQQRADGGFGSRELQYSASEATSWVLITFAQLGLTADNDETAKRAVEYLLKCVDARGGVSTTPLDFDDPRTFPASLALWALSQQPGTAHVCGTIIERLRTSQDPETGGWGVKFGSHANAGSTAQVLHAVRKSGVTEDAGWLSQGKRYLISRQQTDGGWTNCHDEWFTRAVPKTPYRTSHFVVGWALLALSFFEHRDARLSATLAARKLIDTQQSSGAWLYEEFDPTEHVWCTTQAIIALVVWRESTHARVVEPGSTSQRIDTYSRAWVDLLTSLVQGWRTWVLYFIVAVLVVAQFGGSIGDMTISVLHFLRLDGSSVWNNVVSSAIWAAVVIAGALVIRKLSRRHR